MPTKINLTLPRSWNQCTTAQLELIADVLHDQVERTDRYHPFSMQNVKIALFFALSGIEIVEGPNPRVPVEEQYYTCRLASPRSRWFSIGNKSDTFSLYLWQINYWLSPKANERKVGKDSPEAISSGAGLLDWIENDNGQFLTRFPYDLITRPFYPLRRASEPLSSPLRRASEILPSPLRRASELIGRKFHGPSTDLDGFSWSQYRLATEAMQSYVSLSNSLVIMKQRGTFSDAQMARQAKSVDMARAMFLATIFNASVKHIDTATGMIHKDYHYESNQITDNAQYFRHFPDTKWQVILFWWTGIMHTLSTRYPHVFKVQKVDKKKRPSSSMEIYTATIATMQKYVGINEKDCNNQSYSLVLEQLERMSKENEELERMRKKK